MDESILKTGDEPAVEAKPAPKTKDQIAALQLENTALRDELQALKDMVQALASAQAPAPGKPPVKNPKELDWDRPAAKTRTMTGGVTFEQDGKTFDARGRLIE